MPTDHSGWFHGQHHTWETGPVEGARQHGKDGSIESDPFKESNPLSPSGPLGSLTSGLLGLAR